MRENNLLSPHRCRRRGGNPHDGEIITHAPNLMWGTDGVRVFTVDDGWGWIFTAVEHWNAECVGWHVCKRWCRKVGGKLENWRKLRIVKHSERRCAAAERSLRHETSYGIDVAQSIFR